ncbi:hypothetical protein D3C73_1237240 [compost metagenome]
MVENLGVGGDECGSGTPSRNDGWIGRVEGKRKRYRFSPPCYPILKLVDELAPVIFQRVHELAEQKFLQCVFRRDILESIK